MDKPNHWFKLELLVLIYSECPYLPQPWAEFKPNSGILAIYGLNQPHFHQYKNDFFNAKYGFPLWGLRMNRDLDTLLTFLGGLMCTLFDQCNDCKQLPWLL